MDATNDTMKETDHYERKCNWSLKTFVTQSLLGNKTSTSFLNNRNDNEIGFFDSNNHWTYNSHFFNPVWRTSSVMLLFESILFKPSIGKRIEGVIKLLKGSDNPFVHLASIDRDIRVIGFG